jgi:hypothetical protein
MSVFIIHQACGTKRKILTPVWNSATIGPNGIEQVIYCSKCKAVFPRGEFSKVQVRRG